MTTRAVDVAVRRLRPSDIETILVEGAEASSGDFSPPGRRERLLAIIETGADLEAAGSIEYAVDADGILVGTLQVRAPRFGFPPGVCELGITLFATARGRGVGSRAVAAITADLLDDGWLRIQAATSVDNHAMQGVLSRNGFTLEGTLASFAPSPDGGREDYQLWAVTAPRPSDGSVRAS